MNKNFTGSSNLGKNKTRKKEKAALHGNDYSKVARKKSVKYKKAVEDARAAFLMQTGYNQQRSNYDIITPVKDAKNSIEGNNTYPTKATGGPDFVNNYDAAVVRTANNRNGNHDAGGSTSIDKFDSIVKKVGQGKYRSIIPRNTMPTSEKKNSYKNGGFSYSNEASASSSIWDKKERYRDAPSGHHVNKGK